MEQISLGSDRPSVDELDLRQCTNDGHIEQKHRHIPGRQRIDVLDGRLVRIRRQRRGKPLDSVIDLGLVDAEPVFDFHTPWRFIAGSGVALLIATLPVVLMWQNILAAATWLVVLALAALAVALGLTITAWHRFKRRLIFVSRHGRAPLIKLIRNHPSEAEYTAFMVIFRKAIEQGHYLMPDDRQSMLAEEMREHRRLREQGLINEQAYDEAKARLLKLH